MEPQRCYIWRWLARHILTLCAHIFEYYHPKANPGIMQITARMVVYCEDNFLEMTLFWKIAKAHCSGNMLIYLNNIALKGYTNASHCKMCFVWFRMWLTSSTYVDVHIYQSAFECQITPYCMMKLSSCCDHQTFFFRASSFLVRLSDCSAADVTFDPVSARFSTGTQPRSVIQQNQNDKGLRFGYESQRYPVYAPWINIQSQLISVWAICLFWKHTRSPVCIIAINVDEQRGAEKQTG